MLRQRKAQSRGFREHSSMSGEARGGAGWAGSACGIPAPATQPRSSQGRTLTGHHGARLKAVGAGTFEASDDVSAGALATGVPDGALVYVWGRGRVMRACGEPRVLAVSILSGPLPECRRLTSLAGRTRGCTRAGGARVSAAPAVTSALPAAPSPRARRRAARSPAQRTPVKSRL